MEEWAWRAKLRLSRFGGMEYWKTRNAERQTPNVFAFSLFCGYSSSIRSSIEPSEPGTPNAKRRTGRPTRHAGCVCYYYPLPNGKRRISDAEPPNAEGERRGGVWLDRECECGHSER